MHCGLTAKVDRLADGKKQAPSTGAVPDRGGSDRDRDAHGHRVEVTAGGGAVRVRVDGRGRIRALTIEPAAFEGRDAELLSDLVLGAVAEAQRRADELSANGGEAR